MTRPAEGLPAAGPLRLVLFRIQDRRCAFPLTAVERVLPMLAPEPLPDAPPIVRGVVNIRGRIVPVIDVRARLGLPHCDLGVSGRLVLARTRRRLLAAPVDEVDGVREADLGPVAPPESVLAGLRRLSGLLALPDGVLFIHDLESFLSLEEESSLTRALDGTRA
jgi:purine-binding chemotaxis protein CheW